MNEKMQWVGIGKRMLETLKNVYIVILTVFLSALLPDAILDPGMQARAAESVKDVYYHVTFGGGGCSGVAFCKCHTDHCLLSMGRSD